MGARFNKSRRHPGFTLIELLVCIALISILLAVLLPSLAAARRSGQAAACTSNLRQLATANLAYAADHDDYFVPAAPDLWDNGGLRRWHGARRSATPTGNPDDARFDPAAGPLAAYLADGRIKQCPGFSEFAEASAANAYELGSGGYGYNLAYVGSRYWREGWYFQSPGRLSGALVSEIIQPSAKVMFTDAAMPQQTGGSTYLTEESFCTPPHFLDADGHAAPAWGLSTPTIHFRHRARGQVVWCDGHVDGRRMDFSLPGPNIYGADSAAAGVGWFGPSDNAFFCIAARP